MTRSGGSDGSADLQHVLAVAQQIGRHLDGFLVVVNKSTVPVGTAAAVSEAIASALRRRGRSGSPFAVVSNPEFLKEGAAMEDFTRPDRIVIGLPAGAEGERAASNGSSRPWPRCCEGFAQQRPAFKPGVCLRFL